MKKSRRIAAEVGLDKFKGSKGYVHRFIRRFDIVPRSITGSGQQVPHNACAMATQHMAEIGELQLKLGIRPRTGRNGILDETPMWWSMAAKKTLARMGMKHVNAKSTGHERKRFSVALCGFDNSEVCIPMVTFKGLKNVPSEVQNRDDCFVTVSKGGSMTPALMLQWIRKVWAKRPTKTPFRMTNILGMDGHYSHVDPQVLDTLKTVCNTTIKISPPSMTGIDQTHIGIKYLNSTCERKWKNIWTQKSTSLQRLGR